MKTIKHHWQRGMTLWSWWNKNFLLSSLQRTLILTIRPWTRVPLQKVHESNGERPVHTWRKKNSWDWTQWREEKSLPLKVSPLSQGSRVQCQERPSYPVFSFMRESESIWRSIQLYQLCSMLQKKPTSFLPTQNIESWTAWLEVVSSWGNSRWDSDWNISKRCDSY